MSKFRMALLGALVAPALVLAQAGQAQQEQQQPAKTTESSTSQGQVAVTGHVKGVVSNIDYGTGQLSISTGGNETFTLRGTPMQLAGYRRGQVADLNYNKFGNSRWLSSSGGEAQPGSFARSTTVNGTVSSLNKAEGTVTMSLGGGQSSTFQAHPDKIQQLVPGQFISLTYQRIGQQNWVSELGESGSSGSSSSGSEGSSSP